MNKISHTNDIPALEKGVRDTFYTKYGKRVFDVMLALILLPLLLPLILMITIAMAHSGKIIFGHRRVGKAGNEFTCYKFRTMVVDADNCLTKLLASDAKARAEWDEHHKLAADPRVTHFGRILRRTHLDELPQIWNVLRGDMSFVGPRPITQTEISKYGTNIHAYLSVRPGVTGPWQIKGHASGSYRNRVQKDLQYMYHVNLYDDLKLIAKTAVLPFKASAC